MDESNSPFSLDELRKSLDKAHNTECCPTTSCSNILKNLYSKLGIMFMCTNMR